MAKLRRELPATASHGWLNQARYELQEVTTVLPTQRKEDEKASVVVGHVELQLQRDPVMAAVVENGKCALTKTQSTWLRGGGGRGQDVEAMVKT